MPEGRQLTTKATASARAGSASPAIELLRDRLMGLAVKLVWNAADAEEIVQEAFRISVSSGVGFDEERFEPWMVRTVSNLCLNHRRKRRAESLGPWIDPETGETPERVAARSEHLVRVRGAIEKLPPQQRLAITLRGMESMAYEEIAEVMEISVVAARSHVHLARRALAEMIETTK